MSDALNKHKPGLLTFEAAISICEKLLPVCERQKEIAADLEKQDFTAFRPRFEFAYSFCESDEERVLFEQYEIERSKEYILGGARSTPNLGPPVVGDVPETRSPILSELRKRRDQENGCNCLELSQHYSYDEASWRGEYDPIHRRIAQLPPNVKETHQESLFEESWALFDRDIDAHQHEMINSGNASRSKLCRLFIDVAGRKLGDLGFSEEKSKSPRNYPTLTKRLNDFWDLRFAPRRTRDWKQALFESRDSRPWHKFSELKLLLCHSSLHEQVGDYAVPNDSILEFRYEHILPGFADAYHSFFGPTELELIILAHTSLLELVLPEMVDDLLSDGFLDSS